jgi:DNA-binding transcriptional LysR family regulator
VTLGIMQAGAPRTINVAALLAAFRADHPDVEYCARQGHSAEMAVQVREGGLDFAFLALPAAASARSSRLDGGARVEEMFANASAIDANDGARTLRRCGRRGLSGY